MVTLSVVGALCAALLILGIKTIDFASAEGFFSRLTAAAGDAATWRSKLYPENWQPASPNKEGLFLHDFSYAGYMHGEDKVPNNPPGAVYDVTKIAYNADKKGEKDSTKAIQKAIDDAEAAGGGIVYLPAGTYKISVQDEKDKEILRIQESGVVLRGDGPGKTFLFNKTTNMREKAVIRIQPDTNGIVEERPEKTSRITKNYKLPTTELAVAEASKFKVGDWVAVSNSLTQSRLKEMKMDKLWTPKDTWQVHARKVVGVDTAKNTITIDIPTRYEIRTDENPRVFVIRKPIEGVGIERLSFGNEKNPKSGWEFDDFQNKNTGAYQVDMSEYIRVNHVANSWMRQLETYEAPKNGGVHTLSTAIVLDEWTRNMTLSDIEIRSPQYRGGGGNGYGIQIFGGDNLVDGCLLSGGRHNAVFSGPMAMGNVFTNCTLRGGTDPSETHGRFSVANLFDSITLANGEDLTSEDRGDAGNSNHGLTSTQTVFWNITGNGTVTSQQYKIGYVIGTSQGVKINLQGNGGNLTSPTDYSEGANRASSLQPQSLYKNQLSRRLSGATLQMAVSEEEIAPASAGTSTAPTAPTNSMASTTSPIKPTATSTPSPTPSTPAVTPTSPSPAASAPQARNTTFSTPGIYTFTVPAYVGSLKVEVWGAGGGGGSNADDKKESGENGTSSSFDKVIARGGKGGDGGVKNQTASGGAGGTAEGGDDNRTGDNGKNGNANGAGDGGASPKGGVGGKGADTPKNTTAVAGKAGSGPGGGGSGTAKMLSGGGYNNGAGGGGGGYAAKTYAVGALTAGKQITVVVGEGGKGSGSNVNGGNGATGEVRISWTE